MKKYDKVQESFYELCNMVDSPVSLGLWLRYRLAPQELPGASIDPMDYNDAVSFSRDYACVSYLRKYKGLDTGIDLRERALSSFGKTEDQCNRINPILRSAARTGRVGQVEPAILHRAQLIMQQIWGQPDLSAIWGHCGWGPGATSTLSRTRVTREDKMSQFPFSITRAAIPYFQDAVGHDYLWLRHVLKCDVDGPVCLLGSAFLITDESRVLTVPKDSKTDRTIAAEPTLNTYLQKGVGGYLRHRLKRYGIDLDDQKLNQSLASVAQARGLATIDLAAASDSISIGVVRLLCPPEMFTLLERLRSPSYRLDGQVARFHKFSSMGNGFTFELESAIFYSLAKAVMEHSHLGEAPIGVYGDDIIVPQVVAPLLIEVLGEMGFQTNKSKSFITGRFFESCGKHYFDGVDVTPPYQKNLVENDGEVLRAANRIDDWIARLEHSYIGDKGLYRVHAVWFRELSEPLKRVSHGARWMQGDDFFRVKNPRDLFFCPSNGYRIDVLQGSAARSRVADGGLYANSMRQSSDSTAILESPTLGKVSLRGTSNQRFRNKRRWIPLSHRVSCD